MSLIEKIFGTYSSKQIKKIEPVVDKIEALADKFSRMGDAELAALTPAFKERLASGETLDDILPEAFAAVRETATRVLGKRPFRVQLMGGIILHQGRISEMKTGEGKTLVATMPAYLNALTGKGVHIVTVNDYLARRDSEEMGKIFSFLGLTFGRDVTTFCDLTASPQTIDFQGPNAYNFNFATMIRYEYSFLRKHMKIGIAAEMPNVSGTYGTTLAPIPQRVPDVPVYLQVAWGRNRRSHIRASAVFRDMYLRNLATDSNVAVFGWGVQASGNIHIARFLQIFFNGVYGKGITPYLQDLTGSGLDFTPNPQNPNSVQTMPMYGWQAAAQVNILRNLFVSGGYSTVTVCKHNGYYAPEEYRHGQYMFGNIFWNVTRRFCIAAEYLRAIRQNMDGAKNSANRVNFMMQYSF